MAVPNRPVSGQPIETGWGDVVHDTYVAQDLQVGAASVGLSGASSGGVTVTFPRAFAGTPSVFVTISGAPGGSQKFVPRVESPTSTTVRISVWTGDGTAATATVGVQWLAYGPRA